MQVAFSDRSSETTRDNILVMPYLHDNTVSAFGAAGILQNQHPTIKFGIVCSDIHAFSLVYLAKYTTANTTSTLPYDLDLPFLSKAVCVTTCRPCCWQ